METYLGAQGLGKWMISKFISPSQDSSVLSWPLISLSCYLISVLQILHSDTCYLVPCLYDYPALITSSGVNSKVYYDSLML